MQSGGTFNHNSDAHYANRIEVGLQDNGGGAIPAAGSIYYDDIAITSGPTHSEIGAYPSTVDGLSLDIAGWYNTPTATPGVVIRDGTNLLLQQTKASTATGQYYWDGTKVYVVDTPAAHAMEIGQRSYGILADQKSYVTVQDITAYGGSIGGIGFTRTGATAADHLVAQRLTASNNQTGIIVKGSSYTLPGTHPVTNVTIQDLTVQGNTWDGVGVFGPFNDVTVQRVTATGNSNEAPATIAPTAGIHAFGGHDALGTTGTYIGYNWTVQDCLVTQNGMTGVATNHFNGVGIYSDTVQAATLQRNYVHDNNNSGMFLEDNTSSLVQLNVVANHTRRPDYTASIVLYRESNGNKIYNNTASNAQYGLEVGADNTHAGGVVNNDLENNAVFNHSVQALLVHDGGENDGTNGSGNIYLHNALGPEFANFIEWGANFVSTYNDWSIAYCGTGTCSHSVQTDPLFTNAAGGDFTLQATSPAINAGTNLGATYQMGLDPRSSFPWTLLPQGLNGQWDIGAFVFLKHCVACDMSWLNYTRIAAGQ